MKREIKFRLWDGEKILPDKDINYGYVFENCYNADDYILMQFTGLTDKNGKEIYEGDIIARTTIADRIIIFENGGFQTKSINNPAFITHIIIDGFDVVIGNIYENPELLKV